MLNALDLTPRQSTRLLEQAIRLRAPIEIFPRFLPEGQSISGVFSGREGSLLHVGLNAGGAETSLSGLIGSFCEVQVTLSGQVALFSSCVLDMIDQAGQVRISLATPDLIQVSNRRRFERTNATIASEVRLVIDGQPSVTVGVLANLSPNGLACTFPSGELDDHLLVGEACRVSFEMVGFDDTFEMNVICCNKSLSRDRAQLTVGMEFIAKDQPPEDAEALNRLRSLLNQIFIQAVRTEGRL